MSEVDVVVIGAGPAGSTLATLLRRYRPATRVRVLERARFPRHALGESLLVDTNRVLDAMGCLDEVERAGFSRKLGVTFVWGAERSVFTFVWKEGLAAVVDAPSGYQLDYTWHVDRARYDEILAGAAQREGAEVVHGVTALDAIFEDERVVGVRTRDEAGREGEVRARWVVDCGNDHGPLHRKLAGKVLDDELRNVAVYGYLRGVRFDEELSGTETHRRTAILSHPRGWVWVIPLAAGLTSVGFVTAVTTLRRDAPPSHRGYFEQALRALPEHARLFGDAELVDYRGDGKLVHATQEWSYRCARVWGPGWATCGNAAGFVDAILSVGCFVAQHHAQFLACALASVLDGDATDDEALSSYAVSVDENLASFRAVAAMFYAYHTSMSDWWRECSQQLRKSTLVPSASDRAAFLAFSTGFSARAAIYDHALNALGGSFLKDVGEQLFASEPVFRARALDDEAARAREIVLGDPVLALAPGATLRPFFLPDLARGRVRPVVRLDAPDGGAGGATRRLYLPPTLAHAIELVDGRRTLAEIAAATAERAPRSERGAVKSELLKLAYRLVCMRLATEVGG